MVKRGVGVGDGEGEPVGVDRFAVGVLKDYAHEVGVLRQVDGIVVCAVSVGHLGGGECAVV